jgi:hypothetical protein
MLDQLELLIQRSHLNATEKGFWAMGSKQDLQVRTRCLMLIITELAEAVEAIRIKKYAELNKFNNCSSETTFTSCFEEFIKNSFEDEMADTAIRIFDFAGAYNLEIGLIKQEYKNEMDALKGIKIDNETAFMFGIVKAIVDVKFNFFCEQYIGEALARINYLMFYCEKNLLWHIDLKHQYNKTRPTKHNKQF